MTNLSDNFGAARFSGFTIIEVLVATLVAAGAVLTLHLAVNDSTKIMIDLLHYQRAHRLAANLHELVVALPEVTATTDIADCATPAICSPQAWLSGLLQDAQLQAAEQLPDGQVEAASDRGTIRIEWTQRDGTAREYLLQADAE